MAVQRISILSAVYQRIFISDTVVSNELYQSYCDETGQTYPESLTNEELGGGKDHPAWGMDIEEAFSFCQWLSGKLGIDVSIPTEEEWEYAARETREINTRGEMSLILLTAIRTNQILKKRRLSVITKRADPYLVFMIWGQRRGMGQYQISRI